MNTIETVNRLKMRLVHVYNRYGQLTHPEVVRVSQQLDQALNELEWYNSRADKRGMN